jgi:hypothetical protein
MSPCLSVVATAAVFSQASQRARKVTEEEQHCLDRFECFRGHLLFHAGYTSRYARLVTFEMLRFFMLVSGEEKKVEQ